MSERPAEEVILENGNVRITNLRATFGAKTYALSGVTSVEMAVKPPATRWSFALLLVGIMLVAVAFTSISDYVSCLAVGAIFVLGGGMGLFTAKPKYVVRIASASGETDALISEDKTYIEGIVNAMNQAIVKRG